MLKIAYFNYKMNKNTIISRTLFLEQAAMVEIKKEQEHQTGALRTARAKLKLAEEDYDRKTAKILAEKKKYEDRLEAVTETLNGLKKELNAKQVEAKSIEVGCTYQNLNKIYSVVTIQWCTLY